MSQPISGLRVSNGRPRSVPPSPNKDQLHKSTLLRHRKPATAAKPTPLSTKIQPSNDTLIKDLKAQVLALTKQLDEANTLNAELQSRNTKLQHDLASAQARISDSSYPQDDSANSKFKDIHKLISNKLQNNSTPTIHHSPPPMPIHLLSKLVRNPLPPPSPSQPPPPPPPPPMRPLARTRSAPKTPPIVEFYHSLRNQEDKRDVNANGTPYKHTVTSAHSSIVGEIQNRSAHLLAIKADVETKGDFIKGLIQKVLAVAYTDIEDVLKFVDWLDGELSTLADERAVLKHFNWPERKADALREAAIEYRSLKRLENEISSFKDDASIPCGTVLKKMAVLLDKSEQGIGRLIKLRSSVLRSYQDWRIPTSWMLDSGMMSKIKQGSMKLAKMYMGRVVKELESERESNQEALVVQGVRFAYRAHQFVGGLDSETMCAFEEMRQRVPGELVAAIASS